MAGGIFPDSMFPVKLFSGFVFPQQTKPRTLRRVQESFVTGIRGCPSKAEKMEVHERNKI